MMEKRSEPRINAALKGIYRTDAEKPFRAKIKNLSRTGLFMETTEDFKIGKDISIDIDAENIGRIVWVNGHVVRTTKLGAAVEFTQTDERNLEMLIDTEKLMLSRPKPPRRARQ